MSANGVPFARARRLDRIGGRDGVVVGVAFDHRDSLQTVLESRGMGAWSPERISKFKQLVARVLAPAATLMLLDVEFAAGQALAAGVLPGDTALALPLEAQGYEEVGQGPRTSLLDDWDARGCAEIGADACKLLLPFRVDRPERAAQEAVARLAAREVNAVNLALILEPIAYGDPDEERNKAAFARLVVSGAEALASCGASVLKLQYPGSPSACLDLTRACGHVPWVLLGGGADAATLEAQVRDACGGGASGFVVGRTLFNEAIVEDFGEAQRILEERSLPLLGRLAAVAQESAIPIRRRIPKVLSPRLGWHREHISI